MSTTLGSFEEFWAASGPFFERIKRVPQIASDEKVVASHTAMLRIREIQEATDRQMQATDAHLDRLASMIATLSESVVRQAQEIESHERRLERLEGTA